MQKPQQFSLYNALHLYRWKAIVNGVKTKHMRGLRVNLVWRRSKDSLKLDFLHKSLSTRQDRYCTRSPQCSNQARVHTPLATHPHTHLHTHLYVVSEEVASVFVLKLFSWQQWQNKVFMHMQGTVLSHTRNTCTYTHEADSILWERL